MGALGQVRDTGLHIAAPCATICFSEIRLLNLQRTHFLLHRPLQFCVADTRQPLLHADTAILSRGLYPQHVPRPGTVHLPLPSKRGSVPRPPRRCMAGTGRHHQRGQRSDNHCRSCRHSLLHSSSHPRSPGSGPSQFTSKHDAITQQPQGEATLLPISLHQLLPRHPELIPL